MNNEKNLPKWMISVEDAIELNKKREWITGSYLHDKSGFMRLPRKKKNEN